jgi:uncharacterized membrane protein
MSKFFWLAKLSWWTRDIAIAIVCVVMAAIGAYVLSEVAYILTIVTIFSIITLIAINKAHNLSVWVWMISASLILSTTMLGHYIVGSDIHGEYLVANQGFDISLKNTNNTSVLLAFFCPALKWIGISVVWQFKLLFPLLYSFVPVILYFAFKKQIGGIKAFFASLFFIIVPMFFIEIVQIEKSMIAEIFLALMVYVIASKEIKGWKKHLSLVSFAIMATLCHYTIGILATMILVGYYIVPFACNVVKIKAIRLPYQNIKWATVPIVGLSATFFIWFGMIGDGFMLTYFNDVAHNTVSYAQVPFKDVTVSPTVIDSIVKPTETLIVTPTVAPNATVPQATIESIGLSYMDRQEPLVRTAVGLDFFDSSLQGKMFRVVQYLTQALIVIGFLFLLWKYREYDFTPEFIGCTATAFAIILCVVFVPSFSSLINASRWYQGMLFFLSPMFVVGVDQLCLLKENQSI